MLRIQSELGAPRMLLLDHSVRLGTEPRGLLPYLVNMLRKRAYGLGGPMYAPAVMLSCLKALFASQWPNCRATFA